MKPTRALLVFAAFLLAGCGPSLEPRPTLLGSALGPWPEWVPGLQRIDWGAPELLRTDSLIIRRDEFEAYLCRRHAAFWIAVRGLLALSTRGLLIDGLGPLPSMGAVLALRADLPGALGVSEARLQQELLFLGWGQVRLLDSLQARMAVRRAGDPPVLAGRLIDLESDALGARVRALAELHLSMEWEPFAGEARVLARFQGAPLVDLEELKADLLGALTEGDRDRALREYLALRKAETYFGGTRPGGVGGLEAVEGWFESLRARFLAGPGREFEHPELAEAASQLEGRRVVASLVLVPALRASGRPGTRGDQRAALDRARELLARLASGADSAALAAEQVELLPEGPGRRVVESVHRLAEQENGLLDFEPLAGPLEGLGVGCDGAAALLLAPPGAWQEVVVWPGRLLIRIERLHSSGESEQAEAFLARLAFRAWLFGLL